MGSPDGSSRFPFWIDISTGLGDPEAEDTPPEPSRYECRACPDEHKKRGPWVVELVMNFGSFGLCLPRMHLCKVCRDRILETLRPFEESAVDIIESISRLRATGAELLESLVPVFEAVRQLPPIKGRRMLSWSEDAAGRLRGTLQAVEPK